jgi:23S rRNA (uracil1939-C5)-methyltransferase
MVAGGAALARAPDGRVTFIEGAVPGERVPCREFAGVVEQPLSIIAVERSRSAVADARVNLHACGARVVQAEVGRWRGHEVDVVIADPSRAGLRRDGAAAVARCRPERVVLVSCDAPALARDVMLLERRGFALTSVTPVDLFPHTAHVECVSVLDR